MSVVLRWNRNLANIICGLVITCALAFGSVTTWAADSQGNLNGDDVLQKMSDQFSLAQDLTARVAVSIQKGELDLELIGDIKVKGWEYLRLDYLETDNNLPSTIITDGDLVAYYLPDSIKPRISHNPAELGFPLVADLVFAALSQLSQSSDGYLLGESEYLGRDVYMVEIRPKEAETELWEKPVFWVDAQSYLPLRVTGLGGPFTSIEFRATGFEETMEGQIKKLVAEVVESGRDRAIIRMALSRYNENTWFPQQVCMQSTRLVVVQEFSDLKFNVALPDELFHVEEFEILRSAFAKGTAFLASRNYGAAVKEFQKVVSIDPYNIAAHSNLGYAYIGNDDEAGAIAEFEQVIMLAPQEPLGYNNLAYIYIDNGIYLEQGVDMAKKAVELSPGNGAFRDTLGWAYYQLEDYEKAVEELTRAVELMGEEDRPWDRALVHYHLGMVYAAQSRWLKAKEHLNKALDLDPSLEVAKDGLKQVEKRSKAGS